MKGPRLNNRDEQELRTEPIPTLIDFSLPRGKFKSNSSSISSKQTSKTDFNASYYQIVEEHQAKIEKCLRDIVHEIQPGGSKGMVNDYKIGKKIGKGQFGQVYLAQSADAVFAVKKIPKRPENSQQYSVNQVMRQIQRRKLMGGGFTTGDQAVKEMNVSKIRWEAFVASRLHHENILELLECLDSPVSPDIWIVWPWATMGELVWKRDRKDQAVDQWCAFSKRPVSVEEFTWVVLRSLTSGLIYLSQQGCTHRDIKPSNILLDGSSSQIKISDFGSCLVNPSKLPFKDPKIQKAHQEELRKIVGTPAFIPPELCNFQNEPHELEASKIDVWALGVTVYCLLENELPFWGENEFDIFHKIVNEKLHATENQLNQLIISKLLQKDYTKRIGLQDLYVSLYKRGPSRNNNSKGVRRFVKKIRNLTIKRRAGTKTTPNELPQNVIWLEDNSNALNDSSESFSSTSTLDEPVQVREFTSSSRLSRINDQDEEDLGDDSAETTSTVDEISENVITAVEDASPSPRTPNESTHGSSPSPFKIDSPLKNLIRMKNTPEKALTAAGSAQATTSHSGSHMLASRGTLDFSKYFTSPSKLSQTKDGNVDTKNVTKSDSFTDIRKYLNYAE
ncbi:LAMI_0D01046g1_1 [Lachancea mirantina]|uniref:LAMI_0D01046g1_1 n=1 Tax=Lachancea mirantina TaxID=1230905 RepID=A0A1G4J8I2_9SACH|nr:LAMI_0D01046g1_1 [Lachancea mirantina]